MSAASTVLASVSAAACLAVPAIARAETVPTSTSTFERAHLAVEASLGLWTPLGAAGTTLVATPMPALSVEAGLGVAFSGPQASLLARVHPMRGRVQLSLAGGVSGGRYVTSDGLFGPTWTWERAMWANGEVSLDIRLKDDMMLRVFGGMGRLLSSDSDCVASGSLPGDTPDAYGPECHRPGPRSLPSGGIALRSAFTLGG